MNQTTCLTATFFILNAIGASAMAGVDRCDVNGESVNPSNGYTTQSKTGIMRCRSEAGTLLREQEIRQGKFIGLHRFHNSDGSYTESNINDRGNRHERYREFYAADKLKTDEYYDNGTRVGAGKRYFSNGQIQQLSFSENGRELAAIEYQQQGKLLRVRCADRSLLAEDQIPCGFNHKPSAVELHSTRGALTAKESYLDGALLSRSELDENGVPSRTVLVSGGYKVTRDFFKDGKIRRETSYQETAPEQRKEGRDGTEKEWAQNGQQIREVMWKQGFEVASTQWYMNGNVKEKQTTDSPSRTATVRTESFWDNGKPRLKESRNGNRTIGQRSHFDESGRLRKEEFHDDHGVLKSSKEYDAAGKQTREDGYYEDGSRKLR